MILLTAVLRRSVTSGGSPRGASTPFQGSAVNPGIPAACATVGTPGATGEGAALAIAKARILPACTWGMAAIALRNAMSTRPATRSAMAAESRDALLKLGQFPMTGSADDFAQHIRTQTERWAQVIQDGNIAKAE